jgi:hypothetical protein
MLHTWPNPVRCQYPASAVRAKAAATYNFAIDPAPETPEQECYRHRIVRLAEEQGVRPLVDPDQLKADIWESEEELEEFLADVRRSRNANLA